MKLVYKPVGIILGILAGLLAKKLFERAWSVVDDEDPPDPTTEKSRLSKVLAAAALEGVTFKVTRAAVERAGARGFANVTGIWPGKRAPEPK